MVATPDGSTFPTKLRALIQQRFPYLNGSFNAFSDKRAPEDCLYTTATLLWLVIRPSNSASPIGE